CSEPSSATSWPELAPTLPSSTRRAAATWPTGPESNSSNASTPTVNSSPTTDRRTENPPLSRADSLRIATTGTLTQRTTAGTAGRQRDGQNAHTGTIRRGIMNTSSEPKVRKSPQSWRFFVFSAIGIFMFFAPITIGGTSTIPLDHIVTAIRTYLAP